MHRSDVVIKVTHKLIIIIRMLIKDEDLDRLIINNCMTPTLIKKLDLLNININNYCWTKILNFFLR